MALLVSLLVSGLLANHVMGRAPPGVGHRTREHGPYSLQTCSLDREGGSQLGDSIINDNTEESK